MKLLKITRKTNNKQEQLRLIISLYCIMSDIKLSETELTILSYFIVNKINDSTKKLIFKSGLISHEATYKNMLSKFKKLGFIIKDDIKREYFVNEEKFGNATDDVIGLLVKIDNR